MQSEVVRLLYARATAEVKRGAIGAPGDGIAVRLTSQRARSIVQRYGKTIHNVAKSPTHDIPDVLVTRRSNPAIVLDSDIAVDVIRSSRQNNASLSMLASFPGQQCRI